MHGLGNRLRSLAAAHAVARASGRTLIVVWRRDVHEQAEFGELVRRLPHGVRVTSAPALSDCDMYDYMGEGQRYRTILTRTSRDICVRSAYMLVSDVVDTLQDVSGVRAFLRELLSAVTEPVTAELELLPPLVGPTLSLHIRANADLLSDVPDFPPERLAELGGDVLVGKRRSCSGRSFVRAALKESAEMGAANVVIASDTQAESADFARRLQAADASFAGRTFILAPSADCEGTAGVRGARCQQMALAHLLYLARAQRVLQVAPRCSALSTVAVLCAYCRPRTGTHP